MNMDSHRTRITDGRGFTKGYEHPMVNRKLIVDDRGTTLGWVTQGKTFDRSGKCISQSEMPGLLFKH